MTDCRRWLARSVVAAALAIQVFATAGCAGRVAIREVRTWQLRGAVIAVQESSVRVRHKSGQVVVLTVDDETAYFAHKHHASLDQLKVGTRVMVDVQRAGGLDRAVRVQIF